jgi:hypothetical protein
MRLLPNSKYGLRAERKLTMNKNILVIGEVTRNQYQLPRLETLHEGHKPKIVRVSADDFLIGGHQLLARYATNEEHQQYKAASKADDRMTKDELMSGAPLRSTPILHQLAERHMDSFSVIGAIVIDEASWVNLSASANTYIDNAIDKLSDCTIWVARPDGSTEFV